jgi:hypothetical protein
MAFTGPQQIKPGGLDEGEAGQDQNGPQRIAKPFAGEWRPTEEAIQETPAEDGSPGGQEEEKRNGADVDQDNLEASHEE